MSNSTRTYSKILALLPLIAVVLAVGGCARHAQYRTSLTSCRESADRNDCHLATIEEASSYLLGFVEFDDQGWLWNRDQLNAVVNRIRDEDQQQRLLIVTFVHGWKHNASYDDPNVVMFRKNLRVLNFVEQTTSKREGRTPRKIVGVYAGWRGMSQKIWGINNLTFWERKNTAHEVGRGALSELFVRLEDIRTTSHRAHATEKDQTRLIIVGHSFGGAATYSALAPLLIERAIETADEKGMAHPAKGFGDLVILVNPAFEASRFGVLEDIVVHETLFQTNRVNLAIFTSKHDNATKIAFPIGRHVSTLFDKYQSRLERKANTTAVGHFVPYITHDLESVDRTKAKRDKTKDLTLDEMKATTERVLALKEQVRQNVKSPSGGSENHVFPFDGSELRPRKGHNPQIPLYVVSVDPKIIPDHGSIDEKEFLRFLGQFVSTFTPDE